MGLTGWWLTLPELKFYAVFSHGAEGIGGHGEDECQDVFSWQLKAHFHSRPFTSEFSIRLIGSHVF